MTIIDKTADPSPILLHVPKPSFRSELEKTRYWEKEKVKWHEGTGAIVEGRREIPGSLYFKTQELQIKHRVKGHTFRPILRDVDLLLHQIWRDCIRDGEADMVIKGRGMGLSAEFGCLANYFMKINPGSTCLLTSKDKPAIASLFSEKVELTYDNMDPDIQPVEVRRNSTVSAAFLRTEQWYLDELKEQKLGVSEIVCRETSDNDKSATAFSGRGAIMGGYDELFLNKRWQSLIQSSTSCYVDPDTMETIGFLLCGGTVEHNLTNEELSKLQALVESVQRTGRLETMRARLTFIPCFMGKFMTNGFSDEKKGREWWAREVEALEKIKDTKALRAFRMNNPMSLDDIFELTKGGAFEEDVAEKIKAQYTWLLSNPQPEERCQLIEIGGKVEKKLDTKGHIEILEPPKPDVDYCLNVDGVATGKKAGGDEGSNVAGVVVKMFDTNGLVYAPVCIYSERPQTIEQSYYNLAAQIIYYNQYGGFKGVMAEGNVGTADHFSTFLDKHGLGRFVMNRQDLSGKGNSNTQKFFQYVNGPVQDFQYKQANIFLRKYIGMIRMKSLLLDLMKPMSENADIKDAFLMFFVGFGRDFDKPVTKKIRVQTPRYRLKLGSDAQGRSIQVWEEIK